MHVTIVYVTHKCFSEILLKTMQKYTGCLRILIKLIDDKRQDNIMYGFFSICNLLYEAHNNTLGKMPVVLHFGLNRDSGDITAMFL